MLVRRARRSLPLLLAAALALSLTACTSERDAPPPPTTAASTATATPTATPTPEPTPSPTPVSTPTPEPTPSPTPVSTPTPVPTVTPSPAPTGTPSPTPTATPSATPTAAPSPTPTATPSPTPTATPAPLLTAEDLGIREVDTAEALAAAGLTHVRYAAGEGVPWDPGLFLLDVGTGTVEGWVRSLAGLPEEERGWGPNDFIAVSPSNRLLELYGVVYDRQTGRAYRLGGTLDRWWGSGGGERLLVTVADTSWGVLLDGELQPVAQFQLPPGERFTSPRGGYILVRESRSRSTFHLVNLADESSPQVHTWVLPWQLVWNQNAVQAFRIETLDHLVAFVGSEVDYPSACRVTRYDLQGVMLSDQPIPCGFPRYRPAAPSLPRISPDGRLIAVATLDGSVFERTAGMVLSIFDAVTGAEVMRLLGVHASWVGTEFDTLGDVWLADSSGIIVDTSYGKWIVGLDGTWRPAPGWASPDDPDLFFDHRRWASPDDRDLFWTPRSNFVAINSEGTERASLSFGSPSAAIPDNPDGVPVYFWERPEWGARSDTLRVWTTPGYVYGIEHYDPMPPPLRPVIERPPFNVRPLVEVDVGTCLNLREDASHDAPILTCLAHGTVAETDDFLSDWYSDGPSTWMHIRTDDGLEGWASAEYLRWHSDGVRLEETPADTAAADADQSVRPATQPSQSTEPSVTPSATWDTPAGAYTAITVGSGHACALTDAAEAVCWNFGSDTPWDTPPGAYSYITADGSDTCAIRGGGEIVCWGPEGEPIRDYGPDPSRDAPPGRYTALSMTARYACALTDAGDAVCWGSEDLWPVPPDPPPGTYSAISVGSFKDGLGSAFVQACAVTNAGDVVCWEGAHTSGPAQSVEEYPGDYTAVTVHGSGFCALTATGEVVYGNQGFVWGSCGLPGLEGSARYVAISAGQNHTCSISDAGAADCVTHGFGWKWWGAIKVMRPPDIAGADRYTTISVGDGDACALSEAGAIVCWGDSENKVRPPNPAPGPYVAVSDGYGHTCALTESGEAVCWGWNNFGQVEAPPGHYIAINAGDGSTCALTEEGTAVCWGWADAGDFTSGPYKDISMSWFEGCVLTAEGEAICQQRYPAREPVETRPGRFSSIHVSRLSGDVCALAESGEAVCWRADKDAELTPPPGRYVDLSVAHGFACGVSAMGEAICWNDTDSWSAGLPDGRYVAISTGAGHGCALTEAGEARCWGSFDARTKDGGVDYGPVDAPPGHYTAIISGRHRACGLTASGDVTCWGDTGYEEMPEFYLN